MPECRCTTRNFSGQGGGGGSLGAEAEGGGGSVELGHFNKDFVKNTLKRGPAEVILKNQDTFFDLQKGQDWFPSRPQLHACEGG